jgi:formamidopyrimidine-DNA glycosylase
VLDARLVAPETPGGFADRLGGRRIGAVGRRGKHLVVELDGGDALVLHLRMTGQLRWTAGPPEALPYVRARFALSDGAWLVLSDPRRFGTARVVRADHAEGGNGWTPPMGIEPLDEGFTARGLAALLDGRRAPIKALLLDQSLLAGIGNLYADEALFQAALHPGRPAGMLGRDEVARLHRAIRDRLRAGLAAGGASLDRYRDALGRPGLMQERLRVHRHAGEPCPRCGAAIRKSRVAQRGTYWCPVCQPAPC